MSSTATPKSKSGRQNLTARLGRNIVASHHSTRQMVRVVQTSMFLACGLAALLVRFDFVIPPQERPGALLTLLVWLMVKPIVFYIFGLDRGWWRYVSARDVFRIAKTNVLASAVSALVVFSVAPRELSLSRSVFLIDFLFTFVATAGLRLAVRVAVDTVRTSADRASCKRAVIYGAGEAGSTLIRELRANSLGYDVVGFVDDNQAKKGLQINACPVLGCGKDLEKIVPSHQIDIVLIAAPSASGKDMVRILNFCMAAKVECKTIPTLGQIIQGDRLAPQIRNVAVDDLLGREPVQLDEAQIRRRVEGETILVTGAAGTIGSELCRQITRFRPAAIVAFDISETGLFYLEHELLESANEVKITAEIGNIQDRRRVGEVLREHRPSIVFHAAAYKHVPLMENHIFQAVENNVLGTYNVASAAAEHGIRDFVMISSDKAVEPVNVMGATKRAAELVLQGCDNRKTKYVSVRFGNVLGSNGSVIPLFKKQISAGGPVTVTHRDMSRYFMTVAEAAQLVLQAGSMGQDGEVFVLNMGTPVKISDLARSLILLSGLRVGTDIAINYTGLRPGEKLSEKLHTHDEVLLPTSHSKISIFRSAAYDREQIISYLDNLANFCANRDKHRLILALKSFMPEYNPSGHLLAMVLNPRPVDEAPRTAKVLSMSDHANAAVRELRTRK